MEICLSGLSWGLGLGLSSSLRNQKLFLTELSISGPADNEASKRNCDYRQRLSLEDICEVNVWSCWIFFTHSCTPMKGYYIDPQACVIWNFKLCLPDGDQISPLCCQRLTQTPHWMGSLLATMKEEGGKRKEKKTPRAQDLLHVLSCPLAFFQFNF